MSWWQRLQSKLRAGRTVPTGQRGEQLAASYLRAHGHRIRERNWHCPIGEIDMITELGDLLIFVEVKTSEVAHDIRPEQRVHNRKQAKLRSLAEYYIKAKGLSRPCRFDVIAVIWSAGNPEVNHIENAF